MKTVYIYGTIGFDVTADVARDFPSSGKVMVRINSLGGDVFVARVIANAIAARKADVVCIIDGVAASAATVIALACGRVEMAENGHFMIHNPRASVFEQESDGLRSAVKVLDDMEAEYVAVYAAKTGLGEKKIRAMMDAETWLTAPEALAAGFIDAIVQPALELAAMAERLPFDRFRYQNAPKLGESHHLRSGSTVKTKLSAFIASCMVKLTTDARPQSALISAMVTGSGADAAIIQALIDGMLSITPTKPQLEAIAKVLEVDYEVIRAEAAKDWDIFKTAPAQQPGQVIDISAATEAGAATEHRRVSEIRAVFAPYPQFTAQALDCIANRAVSVEAATRILLDALGRSAAPIQPAQPHGTSVDTLERLHVGMVAALTARGDQLYAREHRAELARNEFYGMSMVEMARETLRRHRINAQGAPRDIVGRAFQIVASVPGMGTGNFTTILEDIANKFLHQGWSAAPETWRSWVSVRPMNDFKAHSFFNLSEFDDLLAVGEREEYKEAQFKEAGEKATLATYGRLFSISRQAIINDDTDAFTVIPMKMGRAAARKVGDLAYAILTANAAMADGNALFFARTGGQKSNLRTGAGAPTTAIADALRVLMGLQVDPAGKALNIRPAYVLAPIALEGQWKVVFAAESEVSATSAERASRVPNSVRGQCQVITDPRLDAASAVASYMVADPNLYPGVIMGFLNGEEAPFMDQQDGWTIDGTQFKVRIDAVAKAIDWRALVKNAGA